MSDNSWNEKGELPPVGCKCMREDDTVLIVAHMRNGEHKYAAFQQIDGLGCGYAGVGSFNPIKTERELAIEEMADICGYDKISLCPDAVKNAIIALYDAGYSKNES